MHAARVQASASIASSDGSDASPPVFFGDGPNRKVLISSLDFSISAMGGWQCAKLLDPLYQLMKKELLSSKVIGTDDTSVKVLDRKLPLARIGRIWPYVGDAYHPVIVYDDTPTRSPAGPAGS